MAPSNRLAGREAIERAVGTTRCSDWCQVTQAQIDGFAAVTGDRQWIHRKDAGADGSPFGAPIAHGLLLVSIAMKMAREVSGLSDVTWAVYGFEKLRFRAPVPCGARVKCLTTILGLRELSGRLLMSVRLVLEIEGQRIPALATNCLLLRLPNETD